MDPLELSSDAEEGPVVVQSAPFRWVGLVQKLAVNLLFPFVNGVMLGFGEILAHELGLVWGWRSAKIMPNWEQDLEKAASVGRQAYADYSSGKGLSQDDKQQGEKAAQTLYNDYEAREASNSSASNSGANFSSDATNFENSTAGKDAASFLQKQF